MQTAEKRESVPSISAAVNPLSARLFFRRNLARTAPVALVIVLSVVLIGTVVTIIRSIDLTVLTVYGYNRYFLVAVPRNGNQIDPLAQMTIRAEPLANEIYHISVCFTNIHTIFGKFPFVLFGLTQEDMPKMLRLTRMRLVEGRLPREGEAACALSVGIARNRNLRLGDVVLAPNIEDSFAPVPVKLVGLLDGENWFAVIPKEFVQKHYFPPLEEIVVAAPTPDQQPELDRRLDKALDKRQVRLFTYGQLVRELRSSLKNLYLIMNIVIAIVVLVIAIMMGMLSNIFFMQRLPEFALLAAMGYTRGMLLWRVVRETALLVALGWTVGVLLSMGVLWGLYWWVFEPRGMLLQPMDWYAYRYTIPVPIAVLLFAAMSVGPRLLTMDPVLVIERKV
ncbi:MAG: ABC transporter permease [Armatimonadota bacterium]|nr:ABC transporter permease [Armatimonadota bacterium]MDW8105156.1 ABC transporter permease [Armatimonadota bacterium]